MCQIIGIKTTVDKMLFYDEELGDKFHQILKHKGGDYYGGSISTNNGNFILQNFPDTNSLIQELYKTLKNVSAVGDCSLLLFSRQRPEMEEGDVKPQPYLSEVSDMVFAVHGTIHNDKELATELGTSIIADTEILKDLKLENWHRAEGAWCSIIAKDRDIKFYENGLKIWQTPLIHDGLYLGDIVSTTNLDMFHKIQEVKHKNNDKPILFASFSAGMDISLSVYKALKSKEYQKLVLNYFAWGSVAEEQELKKLDGLKSMYQTIVETEINIINAEEYFDEYFKINKAPFPKISKHSEAKGDIKETESPLAYVPYRNSQFAVILASIAEARGYQNTDIVFGLNLSEGMVFMDNSEGWLESINNTVKYGGKDPLISGSYSVIAPYFSRTKTNMLKEFKEEFGRATLEQLLDLSTSCYYPNKDGSPCGVCGSCILREKALKEI